MRKLIVCVFLVLGFLTLKIANAKEIRPIDPASQDYVKLLNSAGYEAFTFDISDLLDKKYFVTFKIREYGPELINDNVGGLGWYGGIRNITYLKDFDEESQATVTPEEMADPDRGIYSMAEKILIGATPVINDSILPVVMDLGKQGARYHHLAMRPQYANNDSINGKKIYRYYTRRFIVKDLKMGEFIPLVLFGSIWWDDKFKVYRFCGENEIDPDMSTQILKYIPHYFVIGVEIKEAE